MFESFSVAPTLSPKAPKYTDAMNMRYVVPIVVGAVVGIGGGLYVANTESAPEAAANVESADASLDALQTRMQNTLVLPENFRQVPEFSLLDKDGFTIDQTMFDGQWTMAFFGYTHCPDVCPITLQVMKDTVSSIEAEGTVDPMQVAFFTVDPNRDTVERMNEYVGYFDERFRGVTGELVDVLELTGELGIVAAFTANDDNPENYLVDHTASMLLIDPDGRVRARFRPPHTPESIIADYREIIAELGSSSDLPSS